MRFFSLFLMSLFSLLTIYPQNVDLSAYKYFVDKNGKKYYYDDIRMSSETNHAVFCSHKDFLYGCIDQNNKVVLPPKFSFITCNKNLIEVEIEDQKELHGAYNYKYQKVYDLVYDDLDVYNFNDGPCYVELKKNEKCGVGDINGKIHIPIEYDYTTFRWSSKEKKLETFVSNGGHMVDGDFVDGKWGLYVNWKLVVPCQYDSIADAYEDDIYMIKKNGKWGYCGNGKELIPPQYDAVTGFVDGVATVRMDGEVKLIKNPLKDASQIQIAEGGSSVNNKKQRGAVVSRYPKPESDVDKNIPVAQKQAENTFAFIICNENYADAPVPYSLNDGRMFKEYCQKSLGLPEKNINMYEDATFGNIITAIEKMKSIADAYDGEASVIFYYAGHGFPDDKQQTAYLLPIDGDASSITTTGYPLAKLYKEISELKLKSSIVFLDACFSGAKREDQMLASSRGVAIKVKEEAPQGKMVVFSAAQGDETAHQLEDMHHGLFTYYLLKGIQSAGGDPDMGTLTEYVTKQVKRQSVVINNKKQTPTVIPSQSLSGSWQTMKLK